MEGHLFMRHDYENGKFRVYFLTHISVAPGRLASLVKNSFIRITCTISSHIPDSFIEFSDRLRLSIVVDPYIENVSFLFTFYIAF